MKICTPFLLVVVLVSAAHLEQSNAMDASAIRATIATAQGSQPNFYLDPNAVFGNHPEYGDSYQKRARERVVSAHAGGGVAVDDAAIISYYVLACIYEATNGRPNPRADQLEPDKAIPRWKVETGWFTEPDYCKWFGIQCFDQREADLSTRKAQEERGQVMAINLSENDLYGAWPNEVGLLGSSLVLIDLFDNFFLWTTNFSWLEAMTSLKYLFFGTTSFDSNGIPFQLRFVTNLEELDFSNTFWRGTLTENAFNNLKKLRYLDMGQNFFDLSGLTTLPDYITTLPDYISGLPLITNVYIDNIRSTKSGFTNQNIKLTFMTRMPNLVEMWADYTNVNGAIPSEMGNAKKLRSFSCAYCKLTGIIPSSIVKTNMEQMWLYGNPNLKGTFPSGFSTLNWRILHLEGTGIWASFPTDLCDKVGVDGQTDGLILGGNCGTICPEGCCTCCGPACGHLRTPTLPPFFRAPTPAPTRAPPTRAPGGNVFATCFSGSSTVMVENQQGPVRISNLELGDSVQVSDNKFEAIYSFGHINHNEVYQFLSISAEGNRNIEISEDHMVTTEGGRNVPASMIQRGDKLLTASGGLAIVKNVREVKRQGGYAPFTASGKIVVNDIVASSYVSVQGQENLCIAGVETPLSFHSMAHMFQSVHRIVYKMGLLRSETYTPNGISRWVTGPRKAGLWLLDQNAVVMTSLLIPAFALFGIASLFEFFLVDNVFATIAAIVGVSLLMSLIVACHRSVCVQMKKKV